ncbi:unnamed protein product [Rhizophagus irregularis]|uniref:Uncharacterized protein n=1 Tax=Rhizophagus irregularis TaxID=588596 RepID=A0A915ZTE0_9GLOM|nr:unnamed protein product [Rhizophagus irregularis]CAB5390089.1 unnamed protein product [Rhizophagus irregularis]
MLYKRTFLDIYCFVQFSRSNISIDQILFEENYIVHQTLKWTLTFASLWTAPVLWEATLKVSRILSKKCLSGVSASGGGDTPEDVLGGLDAAVSRMTWRNDIRVLLHIGDCPPHGRRFTYTDDNYPDGDPNGLTAEGVLGEMQSAKISYFFGEITGLTKTMISEFKNIIGEFNVFDFGSTPDTEGLVEKFFDATCSAINTAITLRE